MNNKTMQQQTGVFYPTMLGLAIFAMKESPYEVFS